MLRSTVAALVVLLFLPAAGGAASIGSTPCDDYGRAESVFVGTLDGASETDNWWDEFAMFSVEGEAEPPATGTAPASPPL